MLSHSYQRLHRSLQRASEEDEDEEKKHLAPADSATATPPPPPRSPRTKVLFSQTRLRKARNTVRLHPPMAASTKALIVEFASAPTPPSPPPSSLSPWSSPLPHIPSLPLLVLSLLLPLPSPPTHTSLTYDEASLGYKATMIQMRAASPLPVPSPPLLLQSVALRDDIIKADMPLRKRLCLTALASRFEVGESSTADAARQTGHTLASRVDYRFEDRSTTLEASIKTLKDQVRTLQTQHDWIEWQRQQAGDMMTSAFRRIHALEAKDRPHTKDAGPQDGPVDAGSNYIVMDECRFIYFIVDLTLVVYFTKMPPKRTTTPMSDAAIKALVAQSVADALAEHEANRSRNGDDIHDLGSGVFGLTQCFEKMESVFHISNCNVTCQIKFATCTLLSSALMRWNSHFKTVGHDAAYEMTWKILRKMMTGKMFPEESNEVEKYADGLPDMIQGSVIESKPKTMQDEIEFATELMDQKIHTFADLGSARINPDSNAITGTFLLNNRYASIPFDTGVDRSFMSTAFSSLIDIILTTLDHDYDVELADKKIVGVNTIIRGCTLNFLNHSFNINLMSVELGSFDVIISMDWLSKYHAVIVCDEKIVRASFINETVIIHGDGSNDRHESRLNIISCTKTQKYLLKGCQVFLAHITTKKAENKSDEKRLEDVPIVRDFPKLFPKDLSVFMDLMNRVCKPYLDKFMIVFIEDILIYSKNKQEHEKNIKLILELLKKEELYAKFSKCEFWIPKVQFLGHMIDSKGIHVDPAKIESIEHWASPKTPTENRQFLGLAVIIEDSLKDF
nr:reverse transcriptase domain-containing protein [Tanacetum cinerariifolium]